MSHPDMLRTKIETQSFCSDIFGVRRRAVADRNLHVRWLGKTTGIIDLSWPGGLAGRTRAAGVTCPWPAISRHVTAAGYDGSCLTWAVSSISPSGAGGGMQFGPRDARGPTAGLGGACLLHPMRGCRVCWGPWDFPFPMSGPSMHTGVRPNASRRHVTCSPAGVPSATPSRAVGSSLSMPPSGGGGTTTAVPGHGSHLLDSIRCEAAFPDSRASPPAARRGGCTACSPRAQRGDALRRPPHVTIGRLGRWSPAVDRSVHDRAAGRPDLPTAPRASVLPHPGRPVGLCEPKLSAEPGRRVGIRGGPCGPQGLLPPLRTSRLRDRPVPRLRRGVPRGRGILRPGYGQDDAPAAVDAGGSRRVPARSRRAGRRGSPRRHGRCDVGGPARRTSADHEHRRRYGRGGAERQHLGRLAGVGARPCLGGRRAG